MSSSIVDGWLTWRAVVGSRTVLVGSLGPTVPAPPSRVRRGSKPVGTLRHAAMPCLENKIPLVVFEVLKVSLTRNQQLGREGCYAT